MIAHRRRNQPSVVRSPDWHIRRHRGAAFVATLLQDGGFDPNYDDNDAFATIALGGDSGLGNGAGARFDVGTKETLSSASLRITITTGASTEQGTGQVQIAVANEVDFGAFQDEDLFPDFWPTGGNDWVTIFTAAAKTYGNPEQVVETYDLPVTTINSVLAAQSSGILAFRIQWVETVSTSDYSIAVGMSESSNPIILEPRLTVS